MLDECVDVEFSTWFSGKLIIWEGNISRLDPITLPFFFLNILTLKGPLVRGSGYILNDVHGMCSLTLYMLNKYHRN